MPLLRVSCMPGVFDDKTVDELKRVLKILVATRFDCPWGGRLFPSDVEVHWADRTSKDDADPPLLIDIEAKWYPLRWLNFGRRCTQLADDLAEELDRRGFRSLSFGLWPKLAIAQWRSR